MYNIKTWDTYRIGDTGKHHGKRAGDTCNAQHITIIELGTHPQVDWTSDITKTIPQGADPTKGRHISRIDRLVLAIEYAPSIDACGV